jgi:NDP-sugar pyrophosphorylase family protein
MSGEIQNIVVVGGGGHAMVVIDSLKEMVSTKSCLHILGFLDDTPRPDILGFPQIGTLSSWNRFPNARFHIAIGDAQLRSRISSEIGANRLFSAVHSKASVSPHASIGHGCFVGACAVVAPGASLGTSVIVNSGAIVEHSSSVGDYAHLAYGAIVGAEATVLSGHSVPPGCIVPSRAVFGGSA